MSFGSGIGDIIALTELAWKVWNGYSKAPKEFKDICSEIHCFAKALESAPHSWPDAATQDQFEKIIVGCKELLVDLEKILEQNASLANPKGSTIDRLMWGEDLVALRLRIVASLSSLTNFYASRGLHILQRLEKKFGEGKLEPSNTPEPQTITPPLSPRADSAPAVAQWAPPPPADTPERAQTFSNLPPKRTSAHSPIRPPAPPAKRPTIAAKLYSFTHSRQDLLDAIEQANLALVQQLVHDYGRDLNHSSIDRNGETPLTLAADRGHTDIVRWLIDNGADIERRNHFGFSPLAAAARVGKHHVVQLLLERNADTEAKDTAFRATVLQLAIEAGSVAVECIRLLLEAGADVHAVDGTGHSVDHYLQKNLAAGIRRQVTFMLKDYGVALPKMSYAAAATPPPAYDGFPPPPLREVGSWYTSTFWKQFGRSSQPSSPGNVCPVYQWAPISHPVPDGHGLPIAVTTSW